MIVDDDVEIRQLLAEELHDLGHETVHASEGVEALSVARCERPDLILLDLQLPELDSHGVGGGDGFSVLERLQSIGDVAAIPVIVFSGTRSLDAEACPRARCSRVRAQVVQRQQPDRGDRPRTPGGRVADGSKPKLRSCRRLSV
jgi:CheY-like chemotaxis protein